MVNKKSKKIFITGGAGFIGSFLVDDLARDGYEVAVYDAHLNFINNDPYYQHCMNVRRNFFEHKAAVEYIADIRDTAALKKAVADFRPHIMVHLAGLAMARAPENHQDLLVPINMDGTFNVLNVFEKSNAERIIFASSSMAYGHFTTSPQPEDVVLNPINVYGATKAAGEYFVKLTKKEWVIVRATSVYGFTDCANRVTQLLLDAAFTGTTAWVVDGETLDFTYVKDVVSGYKKCLEGDNALYGTFNISRGEARTALEFAELIKKEFPSFRYDVKKPTYQQVWRGSLDISKAKKALQFRPLYSLEKGMKETLDLIKRYNFYGFMRS